MSLTLTSEWAFWEKIADGIVLLISILELLLIDVSIVKNYRTIHYTFYVNLMKFVKSQGDNIVMEILTLDK